MSPPGPAVPTFGPNDEVKWRCRPPAAAPGPDIPAPKWKRQRQWRQHPWVGRMVGGERGEGEEGMEGEERGRREWEERGRRRRLDWEGQHQRGHPWVGGKGEVNCHSLPPSRQRLQADISAPKWKRRRPWVGEGKGGYLGWVNVRGRGGGWVGWGTHGWVLMYGGGGGTQWGR